MKSNLEQALERGERAQALLKAMCDILQKQEKSHYVLNFLEQNAVWDEAVCGGPCLFAEARDLLNYEDLIAEKPCATNHAGAFINGGGAVECPDWRECMAGRGGEQN